MWAHNSHLGDARATEMAGQGELNVGQLVRERHADECVLIGFTTHSGFVTAASEWGGEAQKMQVRPGLLGSVEDLLHQVSGGSFMVAFAAAPAAAAEVLRPERLERAIGVVYRPRTERHSHYFQASLANQFDAVIHVDRTTALQPLRPLELPELLEGGRPYSKR